MKTSDWQAKIRYCNWGADPETVLLPPSLYFEDATEPDPIPRHDHAYQYLDAALERLAWTELVVPDYGTWRRQTVRTQFADDGRMAVAHVVRRGNSDEFIVWRDSDEQFFTLRIARLEGVWSLIHCGIVHDLDRVAEEAESVLSIGWDSSAVSRYVSAISEREEKNSVDQPGVMPGTESTD